MMAFMERCVVIIKLHRNHWDHYYKPIHQGIISQDSTVRNMKHLQIVVKISGANV